MVGAARPGSGGPSVKTSLLTSLAVALALALALPAEAWHCTTYGTSTPELTIDGSAAGAPTLYVDAVCGILGFATNHVVGCGDGAIWIYEESNGIPGQQRADEAVDDTCHGLFQGDTIVF